MAALIACFSGGPMPTTYRHQLVYRGDDFRIDEVIESLRAQEQFLRVGAFALAAASSGGSIEKLDIIVRDVSTASLHFDMLVELYGSYQKGFDSAVSETVSNMFGVDVPEDMQPLLSIVALIVVYWVARFAYEKLRGLGHREKPSIHIEGDNNILLQITAERLGIDPDEMDRAVRSSLPPKRRLELLKRLADLIRPARRRDRAIDLPGAGEISREVLREMPSDAEVREILRTTEMIERPNVRLQIRATDLDHRKRGWAGVVIGEDDIPEVRIPMDVYPTIKTDDLKGEVEADIYIEASQGLPGDPIIPHRIHVIALRRPDNQRPS